MTVGGLHRTAIEFVCHGNTRKPHERRHVAWVIETGARPPVGAGVERTRRGWRLACTHEHCRQNRPWRDQQWRQLVAGLDARGIRDFDLSGIR